jgi:8-oxo-dGTP pyrophosphatase MutT (NUDIX family)
MTSRSPRPIFDPEQLPIEPAGVGLPAVPRERLSISALRERFAQIESLAWTMERAEEFIRDRTVDPRLAAVLVPLVDRPGGVTVLLTHRAAHLSDHAGQISFPGGRCDPEDRDAEDTALREAWEEIGLARHHVEPLGALPDYLTGTGYSVTPVVALVHPPFDVQLSDDEVAEVFEVPLAFLMDPAHHEMRRFDAGPESRRFFAMPYPRQDGSGTHFIWGATAGMLRNLYRFLIA